MNKPLRVYLVEDSPILRDRVTESISEGGAVDIIGYADSEEDALNGIRAYEPDAVVLDIQLRQGNGLNVLRRLCRLSLNKRPLLIVLTNYNHPEYQRRARATGSDYFFDKRSEFHRVGEVLGALVER